MDRHPYSPSLASSARLSRSRCARICVRIVLVLLVTCFCTLNVLVPSAQAQAPRGRAIHPELAAKLQQHADLTLRDVSLTEAILAIRESWNVNITIGGEGSGQISGAEFTDTPLEEVLDTILFASGYGYRPVGRSLVVKPLSELGDSNTLFATEIITLQHGNPAEIMSAVTVLLSAGGKAQSIPTSRSILVSDFPDVVASIRQRAIELDRAAGHVVGMASSSGGSTLDVLHITPQYVKADEIKEALQSLLTADGKLAIVEAENRVVVADYAANLQVIQRAALAIDRPRRQVRIAAYIYDISLQDVETIGINWNSALKGRNLNSSGDPQQLWGIDSITRVAPVTGAANGVMTFMSMNRYFDLEAVINALQESGDSRLLADPNVTVLNYEQAKIEIVQEIPYQQLTQTGEGGNLATTAFREVGITLDVAPRIAADNTITMRVTPTFSRLVGFTQADEQPIIDRRTAMTTVRVKDRQTLVIGGLRQRNDLGEFSGIPVLKDLPHGFGKLFRSRNTTVRESELVVFITPMIVETDYTGATREVAAEQTSRCWLDRIPPAGGCPGGECVGDDPGIYGPVETEGPLQYNTRPAEEIRSLPSILPPQARTPRRTTTSQAPLPSSVKPRDDGLSQQLVLHQPKSVATIATVRRLPKADPQPKIRVTTRGTLAINKPAVAKRPAVANRTTRQTISRPSAKPVAVVAAPPQRIAPPKRLPEVTVAATQAVPVRLAPSRFDTVDAPPMRVQYRSRFRGQERVTPRETAITPGRTALRETEEEPTTDENTGSQGMVTEAASINFSPARSADSE